MTEEVLVDGIIFSTIILISNCDREHEAGGALSVKVFL